MYLLDTNTCIYYLNAADPDLVERVLRAGPGALAVSALTVGELHLGAERSSRREANRARLSIFFHELAVLAFDQRCGEHFGRLKADLLGRGRPIPDFDIAIAATAIANGCTLVSTDGHMEEVQGLLLENWISER
jgi:tRNA(fMet)-specific endonuclease VapC